MGGAGEGGVGRKRKKEKKNETRGYSCHTLLQTSSADTALISPDDTLIR